MLAPRAAIDLLRELAIDAGHRGKDRGNTDERNVVIYGAGDLGNLFIDYLKTCSAERFNSYRVAGYIDDRPSLHGRIMRGFPVMGGLHDLKTLAAKEFLHGVIVAISHPGQEQLAELHRIAKESDLHLYSWCFDLTITPLPEPQMPGKSRKSRESPLVNSAQPSLEPCGASVTAVASHS